MCTVLRRLCGPVTKHDLITARNVSEMKCKQKRTHVNMAKYN